METLSSVFPHIPNTVLQRVLDIFNQNITSASTWILENDWRNLSLPGPVRPDPTFVVSTQFNLNTNADTNNDTGATLDIEDDDEEDEEDNEEEDDDEDEEDEEEEVHARIVYDSGEEHLAREHILESKRMRITVNEERDNVTKDGYWAAFDGVVVQKTLIELLNINLSKLAHHSVALLNYTAKTLTWDEAARQLVSTLENPQQYPCHSNINTDNIASPMMHAGQKRKRLESVAVEGIFAHFLPISELDVTWRSVLHAHLFSRKFGERIEFHSASGGVLHRRDFDELQYLYQDITAHRALSVNAPLSSVQCCLVLPSRAEEAEIFRVGRNIHRLLKLNCTLYYSLPKLREQINCERHGESECIQTSSQEDRDRKMTEETFRRFAKYRIIKEEKSLEKEDVYDSGVDHMKKLRVKYSLQVLNLQGWNCKLSE